MSIGTHGSCPHCGEETFIVLWYPSVKCRECGETYDTKKPLKTPTRERKADRKRA